MPRRSSLHQVRAALRAYIAARGQDRVTWDEFVDAQEAFLQATRRGFRTPVLPVLPALERFTATRDRWSSACLAMVDADVALRQLLGRWPKKRRTHKKETPLSLVQHHHGAGTAAL
jgi:hypothetical protein